MWTSDQSLLYDEIQSDCFYEYLMKGVPIDKFISD